MPIRIYDIAQELSLDSHTVLAKAKELGIAGAKVPSSSLDKITGEYLREKVRESLSASSDARNPFGPAPVLGTASGPPPSAAAQPSKAHSSITLRLNGAEYLESARAGELHVFLEIAETEGAPPLKIRLSQDGISRALPIKPKVESQPRTELDDRTKHLFRQAYYASRRKSADDWVNLAALGNALKDAEPTFTTDAFGERSLGSLLRRMTDVFDMRADESNPIVYYVRIKLDNTRSPAGTNGAAKAEIGKEASFAGPAIPTVFPKLATGKIHNLKLGFGFIAPDDGSENPFFHATEVIGCTIFDLRPGDPVEYEPGVNERGLCARKVRRVA
jgi:cold shock CspA family protein